MTVGMECKEGALVVRPRGELDLGVADELRNKMERALDENPVRHLVINLENVSFIDSSGLGVILGRYKKVAMSGGRVSLVKASPQVRKVMEMSGLLRIMKEFASEEEALKSFHNGGGAA